MARGSNHFLQAKSKALYRFQKIYNQARWR